MNAVESNTIHNYTYYDFEQSSELSQQLKKLDHLNEKIYLIKQDDSNLWQTIIKKLKINWTYNSNSIEGSTLSLGDTHFFLTEGLTVEGKPFKDFLDAKNHIEAIEYLYDIVANRRDFSEGIIKEINALLLSDVKFTKAQDQNGKIINKQAKPGEYKLQSNHVLLSDGKIHQYVEPLQVRPQMQALVEWVLKKDKNLHPLIIATILHYNLVRIHAFDDGNGRGARIIMNLILMKYEYFPIVLKAERKRFYLSALHEADNGNIEDFISFIANEFEHSLNDVLSDLNNP